MSNEVSPNQTSTISSATDQRASDTSPGEPAGANVESGTASVNENAAQGASGSSADDSKVKSSGPLSLERIRQLRAKQQAAKPSAQSARPASGAPKPQSDQADGAEPNEADSPPSKKGKPQRRPTREAPVAEPLPRSRIAVPSRRAPLPDELERELNLALVSTDLQKMLIGDAQIRAGLILEEGQRLQGKVIKVHGENVFVSLGGSNEGIVSVTQFEKPPEPGAVVDVVVRSYLNDEGLYELNIPGNAVSAADWADLKEGDVVEARVTGSNAGGLECTVGSVQGFIPISQITEYRVENIAEFVDQRFLCVVTEVNPARGNLVLSRRAVLEREKAEKREQRLAQLEVGSAVEGVVRKILDFGAFVDIGGLDGLLHISQLSWERVKHPSEILQEGQKIQVRIEKIDEQTGKIGLSYRSLQDHPWEKIDERFPVGTLAKGTVSRIANFGAFVKLAVGVEGLIHLSELAHYRVQRVTSVVQEGQEVEVKVLSVEPEAQRISLSLKAAQQAPAEEKTEAVAEASEEAPVELALPKHRGPLKGGVGKSGGGEQFGLKW